MVEPTTGFLVRDCKSSTLCERRRRNIKQAISPPPPGEKKKISILEVPFLHAHVAHERRRWVLRYDTTPLAYLIQAYGAVRATIENYSKFSRTNRATLCTEVLLLLSSQGVNFNLKESTAMVKYEFICL